MNNFNKEKINKHFSAALYFEDLISKKNVDFKNTPIPDDYTYLVDYYDLDVLNYYRINKLLLLMEKQSDINKVLIDFFNSFSTYQLDILIKKTKSNGSYEKLLKKRFMTSNLDFIIPSITNNPTATLLKIYADIYETEEMLIFWRWIADLANNKTLSDKFPINNLKKIDKTRLIREISRDLSTFPKVKKIFKLAYNSNLRHLMGHSNAYLDDVSRYIVAIDKNKNFLSYEGFFNTFYAIQQIDNITTLFLELKGIDNTSLLNKGFIGSLSVMEPNWKSHLILFQLESFYENDISTNSLIDSVSINFEDGDLQIIHNDFLLHSIKVDDAIRSWFTSYPTDITLVACSIDITNNIPLTLTNSRFNDSTYFLNYNKVYKIPIEKNK